MKAADNNGLRIVLSALCLLGIACSQSAAVQQLRSGRADLWIAYDTTKEGEIILKEERDLNGDGLPDLWSHYDRGRLVRRDLNTVGLEVFLTPEDLPRPSGEIRQIYHPGN